MSEIDYRHKVVVVTGASSGIGYTTAKAFAERGATTVGVARRTELLQKLVDDCRGCSGETTYLAGDLGEQRFAQRVIEDTVVRHGRIDILVNNAGIPMHKHIYETTAEDVDRIMRINFMSSVWTSLAAIPHMLNAGGGWIVNVSSFASKVSPPRETAYAASKCAMDGFTAGLWNDLQGSNIHAALVIPGPIDTEIWDKDETLSEYSGSKHPPKIVTDAIFDVIENRRHEVIVPNYSPQLVVARLMRSLAPGVLRTGMAWMEPVASEVVEQARADAAAHGRRQAPGE